MNDAEQTLIPRKTLTLSKPLASKTLAKIKVKRTPEGIKKQIEQDRRGKQQRIQSAVHWLYHRYPDCFNPEDPKPLKTKIEVDVFRERDAMVDQQEVPSRRSLRNAIGYYTRGVKYLRAHLKYECRINLQGEDVKDDLIMPDQKDYAAQHLSDIKTKYAETKAKKMHRHKSGKKGAPAQGPVSKKTGNKQEKAALPNQLPLKEKKGINE